MNSKIVKMIFSKDMFYNDQNVPMYVAGKVYDIEERMVARWLKRGGQIVDETTKVETKEHVETPTKKEDDGDKGRAHTGPRGRNR